MAELVSPCCGYEYSEFQDNEGYDMYICENNNCHETFSEPIEDYEFSEAAKEAKLEDEADERRDLGL